MVPDTEGLTKQAAQRLDAIQQMEELGSGFYLAMHDLEIRGTGEVLGESQSGNMTEIGFQLYNEMLSEAVRALKAGQEPDLLSPLSVTTEINLHAPALLPDDYCGDVHLRLSFYKKLATAKTPDQIDTLLEEIVDRFGKLPPQAQTLIDTHRLRVLARPYGVVKVDAAPGIINITFKKDPPVDGMAIIQLIQKNKHIKLAGNEKLRIERELKEPKERAQMVRDVLRSLGQPTVKENRVKPPLKLADFKLIAFDMDSTLINIECVDEIADAAGRKAEVAAITEAAMRGEITDYKDSLRRRVALLRGQRALQQVAVDEVIANATLEFLDRRGAGVHFSSLKNRLGRASSTQVQGLKIEASGFQDSRMIWALPTRFSAGTMPTPPSNGSTRLSDELSRLSPIMK
eukprot:gene38075-51426_t